MFENEDRPRCLCFDRDLPDELTAWTDAECAGCKITIYDEWRLSYVGQHMIKSWEFHAERYLHEGPYCGMVKQVHLWHVG